MRFSPTTFLVFALFAVSCAAQSAVTIGRGSYLDQSVLDHPSFGTKPLPNGISVGEPKVFDNRTLVLMLENLSANLQSLQSIDHTIVKEALKSIQGLRNTSFESQASVTGNPIAAVQTRDAIGLDADGKPLTTPPARNVFVDQKEIRPTAPVPGNATTPAISGFAPSYALNASDLLGDQVNLNYQIFNLRMLLDRALSDRLWNGKPRLQAVIGFNVSLDPPQIAKDAVAVVEITLKRAAAGGAAGTMPISLVSVLPQEKTYNAAAISTKSNAFGGAAVVNAFQLGYSQRSRDETFYVYRDTDTLAYQRTEHDPRKIGHRKDEITFGWMFRPVLGRRSLSPGMRQMFAIIALPDDDSFTKGSSLGLAAEVRTYWKKYDRDTSTSYLPDDASRVQRFLHVFRSEPKIFDLEHFGNKSSYAFAVDSTFSYDKGLKPEVKDVIWTSIGANTTLISVKGENFFTRTRVALGDRTFSDGDGLVLKSAQAFDLSAPADIVALSAASVVGRYGSAVPLETSYRSGPGTPSFPATGAVFKGGSSRGNSLSGGATVSLKIFLTDGKGKYEALTPANFPKDSDDRWLIPLVLANGTALPRCEIGPDPSNDKELVIRALVPDSLLKDGAVEVKVSWPFLKPASSWTPSVRFHNPKGAFVLTRLAANTVMLRALDPRGFDPEPPAFSSSPNVPAPKAPAGTGATAQTITFGPLPAVRAEAKSISLNATATSGLPVTYEIFSGPATVAGNMLTLNGNKRGKVVVRASQAGDATYAPAADVDVEFEVLPARYWRLLIDDVSLDLELGNSKDGAYTAEPVNSHLFRVKKEHGKLPEKLVIVDPLGGGDLMFDIPEAKETKAPPPPPALTVPQFASVWIQIEVKEPAKVIKAEANKIVLNHRIPEALKKDPANKIIEVQLTQELTAKPASIDISITYDQTTAVTVKRIEIQKTESDEEKAK